MKASEGHLPGRCVRRSSDRIGGLAIQRHAPTLHALDTPYSAFRAPRSDAQSLIIVLGMLATFAILAIGFSIAIRSERVTARGALDEVRARQLVHVGLVQAMAAVGATLADTVYPYWEGTTNGVADALGSVGGGGTNDLLSSEALEWIPGALRQAAREVRPEWRDVTDADGVTNGRVAFLVVNCSGLIDANAAGGLPRADGTNVGELALHALPELTPPADTNFYANRAIHRRYETPPELARLNAGTWAAAPDHLFTFLYDPDPDAFYPYPDTSLLGTPLVGLRDRLQVNALPSYSGAPSYTAYDAVAAFTTNYLPALTAVFVECGYGDAPAMAWNTVNYLDADRLPQSDEGQPWLSGRVVEAVPLVNELVRRSAGAGVDEVAVEVFFPFVPAEVTAGDGFRVQVGLYTNAMDAAATGAALNGGNLGLGFSRNVGDMAWGTTNAFRVFTSSPFASTSIVWVVCRVTCNDLPVDQAPGASAAVLAPDTALSVDDPRANGEFGHWEVAAETLGTTNANCTAAGDEGLPVLHRDGPMLSAGEIGHIFLPGTQAWRSVDLYTTGGGALLDRLTVRTTNTSVRGLVAIGTGQTNVLRTLFRDMPAGYSNTHMRVAYALTNVTAETALCEALVDGGPYLCFEHLAGVTNAAAAFQAFAAASAPPGVTPNDILREAPLAGIHDLVSFRQNAFTVIVAAQAFGRQPHVPVAESRAAAIVCRDAYTGRAFVRCLHTLTDE